MTLDSYFLLKPEACFHSDKIEEIIRSRDIDITSILKIDSYFDYASKIYELSYGHNKDFYTLIKTELLLERDLYSDDAVVLRVSSCADSLESFLEYITATKDIIRKRLSLFCQRKVYVLVNYTNYTDIESNTSPYGSLKTLDDKGNLNDLYRLRRGNGEWGVVLFSLIHSPGPSLKEYEEEIKFLNSSNYKSLSDTDWVKMKKYKSFYCQA